MIEKTSTDALADAITSLLSNPNTPDGLYNSIAEALLEMADATKVNITGSPEVLRVSLPLIIAKLKPDASATPTPDAAAAPPYNRYARTIADWLEDDETPEVLHTTLDNFCTEISNMVAVGSEVAISPDSIRKNLPYILERAEKAGLSCPTAGVMLGRAGTQKIGAINDVEPDHERAAPAPGARPTDELRTRRLVIVDDAGQQRAIMETIRDVTGPGHTSVVLSMFDAVGDLRLTARVGDDGEATFNAFSIQEPFEELPEAGLTVQRLRLGCMPSDPEDVEESGRNYHTPELTFFDGVEGKRAALVLGASGAARLEFFDLMGGILMGLQDRGLRVWADKEQMSHCYVPARPKQQ